MFRSRRNLGAFGVSRNIRRLARKNRRRRVWQALASQAAITFSGSADSMQGPAASSQAHATMRPLDGLTALRILPALYVLAFHYGTMFFRRPALPAGLDLGYSGVSFFFMLSGFILAYNYAASDFSDPAIRQRYALARFARIYPVFILSIVAALPFYFRVMPPLDGMVPWLTTGARIGLTVTGLHAWVPGAACAINCPSWSISTEFFFYATLPFLLPAILLRPKRWLALTLGLLVLGWCIGGLVWHAAGRGLPLMSPETHRSAVTNLASQFVIYFPLARLPEFLLGILLYVYWASPRRLRGATLPMLAIVAATVLLSARTYLPEVALSNGLTGLVWAPLILAAADARGPWVSAAWPLWLGRISFSLYLLHVPMAQAVLLADMLWFERALLANPWIGAGLATALTLGASALAYAWVEEPARRRILRARRPSPAREPVTLPA